MGTKILYAAFIREEMNIGCAKKVFLQCLAFLNMGFEPYIYTSRRDRVILYRVNQDGKVVLYERMYKLWGMRENSLRFKYSRYKQFLEGLVEAVGLIGPDVMYIRRIAPITPRLIGLLNRLKKEDILITYEYPGFPWKNEMKKIYGPLQYTMDLILYKFLFRRADLLTAVMVEDIKPCYKIIPLLNGFDAREVRVKKHSALDGELNLLAMAQIERWHGYDRVIEGLKNYYSKREQSTRVCFHVVGEGVELPRLMEVAHRYGLSDYVTFHGLKTGRELDEVFDMCHMGVGSIANHRKDMYRDSALKNREYCARGIPFIIASSDLDFGEEFQYVHRVSADDGPVDIDGVIKYFGHISKSDYSVTMREYAENNLDWERKMAPVSEAIKSLLGSRS